MLGMSGTNGQTGTKQPSRSFSKFDHRHWEKKVFLTARTKDGGRNEYTISLVFRQAGIFVASRLLRHSSVAITEKHTCKTTATWYRGWNRSGRWVTRRRADAVMEEVIG